MPRHQDADAFFETPQGWQDRTIVAHAASTAKKGDPAPNFVMTKDPIREGDSLRGHVDRQMLEMGRHLKDFDLLEIHDTVLGGEPAVFLRYTWMGHFGRLEQTVTAVERLIDRVRMATSFTTTAPAQDAASVRPMFDAMLKSVRFGGGSGPPGGALPSGTPPAVDPRDVEAPSIPMPGYTRGERR